MDTPADASAPPTASSSSKPADPYGSFTHYGAVDWARGHHDVCVVGSGAKAVAQRKQPA